MRDLKHHEQKLLKKVNFLQWKSDQNIREIKIMRRYHVQSRDDYIKYNKLAGHITSLTNKLKELPHDVSPSFLFANFR
jgi:U3 small nucleolar ribonucleoprotein protein IMP3